MSRRLRLPGLGLFLIAAVGIVGAQEQNRDEPREIGLVEQTGTRLAQIDVTVIAAPEVLAELTADDFKVKVNMTKIKEFRLDR
ncbi:MAG: hypothetical protein GY716_09835, partial [bacterium]|nr:hypothetical protein [bacterium]